MIKVLLADDHRMVREGLRYLLKASGDIDIIATAANGREALEYAIEACPDVAVLDVSMPEMDGIEASRYIRDYCPNTGIVMLSMYNTPEYVRRALRAGARGYVLKDAAGEELVEAVRTLASGKRYFSPGIEESIQDL
jgi:DNA-binding NarL/FixJ family response regulator